MARARLGLAKAVHEILERRGVDGRRLSYRQAERLTGLSPATIGELAKGNARTAETVRRFALGMGEEPERLLLLAGLVQEDRARPVTRRADPGAVPAFGFKPETDPEARELLTRWEAALARLQAGRERCLFLDRLRQDAELMERFVEHCGAAARSSQRAGPPAVQESEEDPC